MYSTGADVSFDEGLIDGSNTARSLNTMTSSSRYKNITPCNVVLTDFIQNTAKTNVASEPTINPSAKRARLDVSPNGDSNIGEYIIFNEIYCVYS